MQESTDYTSPPLNYLIHGHPGTGKRTYASQLAVALADQLPLDEVLNWPAPELYNRYQALVNEGQLFFLTMHPGWTYADMIERCLFQENNVIVHDGILKQIATEARGNLIEHLLQAEPGIMPSVDFKELYTRFVEHLQENGEISSVKGVPNPFLLHSIMKNGDILLRKPKTFQVIRIKRSKLRQLYVVQQEESDPQVVSTKWQNILEGENLPAFEAIWSQFNSYQMAYSEATQPVEIPGPDPYLDIQMDILPSGVLQSSKKYVLILEHIQMIEPQALFGDALPILDSRRREGCRCAQSVILPGSKTSFTLPPNLFMIGISQQIPSWSDEVAFLMSKVFQFVHLDANQRHQDWPVIRSVSTLDLWNAINAVITTHRSPSLQFPGGAFQDCSTVKDLQALFAKRVLPYLEWLSGNDAQLHQNILQDLLGPLAVHPENIHQWKLADFKRISRR
ncbi:MAG: AAA family ATPase [Saprospiraceae bacterium]|nr:AAA family ATPase [Saprospiraceae bacterium]